LEKRKATMGLWIPGKNWEEGSAEGRVLPFSGEWTFTSRKGGYQWTMSLMRGRGSREMVPYRPDEKKRKRGGGKLVQLGALTRGKQQPRVSGLERIRQRRICPIVRIYGLEARDGEENKSRPSWVKLIPRKR